MAQTSDDILRILGEIIEENIKEELLKPRQSRGFDGRLKSPGAVNNRVYSGNLLNATTVKFETDKDGSPKLVVEFPGAPEWQVVNSGRRGKQQSPALKYPPLSVITTWARTRTNNSIPQFRDKKGRFMSNKDRAFLIQRSIGEKGIAPTFFLDKAIENSMDDIAREFGIYGQAFIEEIIQRKIILRTGTRD
jgi:hypothetical protein